MIVTHPFHPLNGQRLEVLYVKRRGADTVFVCSGGVSGQITLPQAWTDRGEPPLGRRLSAEGLAGLDTLARSLAWSLTGVPVHGTLLCDEYTQERSSGTCPPASCWPAAARRRPGSATWNRCWPGR